ncbi:MAG: asparagine synthase (glutamine-hydrolyzing) [Sphingomonadales bacterium]|nr:asparagine synthase (glutamine-hydrolyzing) [Sphingomonadales bacterium]
MCGIAGLLRDRGQTTVELIRSMTARITPRGPDSSGEWIGANSRLGFGHRRLAIVDLSPAGHQPMQSACGRYTITYNGEIYNFPALRAELEARGRAPAWRGHSDTEVLLALIAADGVSVALRKAYGMFAFALWDDARQELTLARDRFGEKPLYYGWTPAGFAFASTLGPIEATPDFNNPINQSALAGLLSRAYIPAPQSIYSGIAKLPPGCLLTIPLNAARGSVPSVERYFDYGEQVSAGAANQIRDKDQALEELDAVLGEVIARQLVADVPIGCLLSGGIDSSLVTAIAQKCSDRPLKTFTIGFTEAGFDEAVHAKRVAEVLGTDHTQLYVTSVDALAVIPMLPAIFDEPFADSSQIPTYLVSKLAREQVTVSLSGDAGDELFGGYNRHIRIPKLWRRLDRFPRSLRHAVLGFGGAVSPAMWNRLGSLLGANSSGTFGYSVQRGLSAMAEASDVDALLDMFLDDWAGLPSPMLDKSARAHPLATDRRLAHLPLETRLMHADAVSYLPGDVLAKVDRAGMAVSLESRIPFLDPQVSALAARIDPALNFANGGGKDILKQLLYRHVPRELVDRPKAGFAIPIGAWLRGALRDWAEDLLSENALRDAGVFDVRVVRSRWTGHLSGRMEATQPIWSVLMYQAWQRAR